MNIDEKLNIQADKYGRFDDVSAVTDGLLMVAEGNSGIRTRWSELSPQERTVLRGILTKLGRLLAPDFRSNGVEQYDAITGYAVLGRNALLHRDMDSKQEYMDLRPRERSWDEIVGERARKT